MTRPASIQLNVRSRFARERAGTLARQTGMTTTQIVEEALRAYLPPSDSPVPGKLVRKGVLLVRPALGRKVSLEEANAALEESRSDRD